MAIEPYFKPMFLIPFLLRSTRNRIVPIVSLIAFTTATAVAQTTQTDQAVIKMMEGDFKQAGTLAAAAIRTDHNNAMAYAVAGRSQVLDNNLTAAQSSYDQAIRLNPNNGLFYALKAACYQFQQQPDLSTKTYDKAHKLLSNPATALDYYALGLIDESLHNTAAAMNDYAKAISLQQRMAIAYLRRGILLLRDDKNDDGIAEISKALAINPSYGACYGYRANAYSGKDQYELAIADYTKAISYDPKDGDAYFNRAVAYKKWGHYDQALADYAKVEEITPKDPALYGNRALVYMATDKVPEAFKEYCKAINLAPKNPNYLFSRGQIFERWQQYDSAMTDYNRAIAADPRNENVLIQRGILYSSQLKAPDKAMADFQKVIEINPNNSYGYMNMGAIQHNKQQYSLAISNYTKAIELDPKNMFAYGNRADAYEAIGNKKQANLDRKKYADLGGQITASGGDSHRSIFPEGTFDPKLAAAALQRGTSTIMGRACTKIDGLIFSAKNVKVVLFPETPYLDEWYALREKKEGKNTSVYMSDEANKYCVVAYSGDDGRFVFEGLKPGKYFIQLIHSFNQQKTARVYTGSDVFQNGPVQQVTNYYYDQDYLVGRSTRLERFVEIKEDGETKKITLAKGLIKTCDF
ncbi:MAG: tetratricopeptide repeat protein [Chitinophaga sp.]|uniref:tetratricopeptide repeat protein n=1 Tax=Chitinophaga sp. TaxID=1869181 RepID=UPI0025C2A5EE|nr:tetratricopeptide repeat protein [Chitinophaga sp.]MBV8251311.1 tetratricopeptide repeat protein [Chitinophaga sp.]